MGGNSYQDQKKKQVAFILILILCSLFIISKNAFADRPESGEKDKMPLLPTNIYGADDRGKFISDPVTWIRKGYNVLIQDLTFVFRAQVFDQNGYKMSDTANYTVPGLGLRGEMFIFNPTHRCQKATIQRPQAMTHAGYEVIIRASNARQTILVHVGPAGCDAGGCHRTAPPKHVIEKQPSDNVKSRCNNCHNLALKIHTKHYNKVSNDATGCYICHPHRGCLIGLDFKPTYNPHLEMTCIDCHGTLADSVKGAFKIRRERGLPRCDDCHDDESYSYPKGNSFRESYGHGGVACINCHSSTHLANHTAIGSNACARACHTTQPDDSKMGPDCGRCHNSSIAPHLVNR